MYVLPLSQSSSSHQMCIGGYVLARKSKSTPSSVLAMTNIKDSHYAQVGEE
jgi:hypothetical protein